MLHLHIAVILPFATCQFVLPSSSSSETDSPIDRLECMESCSMRFLNTVSSSGTPSMEHLCDGFVEMKECVLGCPGGTEAMKVVAGMVPQSFRMVTEMCQEEVTTGTPSPVVLSGAFHDSTDMENLNHCVIGCERYLQVLRIGGPDGFPGLGVMCKTWGTYHLCVIECPEGAEMMTYVQKMMPSIFKTIKDTCAPVSSTGPSRFPLLLNRETTTYYPDIELTTDYKHFEALPVTLDALESMLKCKGKCFMDLDELRVSSGVVNLCFTWKSMKRCLGECIGDPQMANFMLEDVSKILPRTVDYLTYNCKDEMPMPPLYMDYDDFQRLLDEEKAADEMKLLLSLYKK